MIDLPTRIALFTNVNIRQLESEVNSFIAHKNIVDIRFSDRSDADGLAVMVIYEE